MIKLLAQIKSTWERLQDASEGYKAVCYCCLVFLVIFAVLMIILYRSHHGSVGYYIFFALPFVSLLLGVLASLSKVFIAITIAFHIVYIVHISQNSAGDFSGFLPFIAVYVFLSVVSSISFRKVSQK